MARLDAQQVSVLIPRESLAAIERLARAEDRTRTAWIRRAIEDALSRALAT